MDALVGNAKGKEKVGRLYTNEERKKIKERNEFENIWLLVFVFSSSPEDPLGEGETSNQAEVLLITCEALEDSFYFQLSSFLASQRSSHAGPCPVLSKPATLDFALAVPSVWDVLLPYI